MCIAHIIENKNKNFFFFKVWKLRGGGGSGVCVCSLSHIQLFVTPWTVALYAPLSTALPRHEYWSRLPFPAPGDLPDSGIKPTSLVSPALAGRFFTTVPPDSNISSLKYNIY